jgi:hypothetical protein
VENSQQEGDVVIADGPITAADPDGISKVEFSVKSGNQFFSIKDPTGWSSSKKNSPTGQALYSRSAPLELPVTEGANTGRPITDDPITKCPL